MHNYQSIGEFDKSHWNKNSHILEEYIDFNSYNIWIPGTSMTAIDGTYVSTAIESTPTVELPDVVTTTYSYTFRKPRTWTNGTVGVKVWWTGDTDGGNALRVSTLIQKTSLNEAISTTAFGTNLLIPEPISPFFLTVEDGFLDLTDVNKPSVDFTSHLLTVSVRRLGSGAGDTYSQTMYLIGLEVIYKESSHQKAGLVSSPIYRAHAMDRL